MARNILKMKQEKKNFCFKSANKLKFKKNKLPNFILFKTEDK